MDTTLLGEMTAEMMELLGDRFDDSHCARTVAIVVEVDSESAGQLVLRCSDDRPWVLQALFYEAADSVADMRAKLERADGTE